MAGALGLETVAVEIERYTVEDVPPAEDEYGGDGEAHGCEGRGVREEHRGEGEHGQQVRQRFVHVSRLEVHVRLEALPAQL